MIFPFVKIKQTIKTKKAQNSIRGASYSSFTSFISFNKNQSLLQLFKKKS